MHSPVCELIKDPTQRFSGRAENYSCYRPTYPDAVLAFLMQECQLTADSIIADVGSGTGLLTEIFLRNGNAVYGIEPNPEMRDVGERRLQDYPRFISIAATAESTTLNEHSVHFVTAGRSFQWFDFDLAIKEFSRILKPEGWTVLLRLKRRTAATPFLAAYERLLLTYATDYNAMKQKRDENEQLLVAGGFKLRTFEHRSKFDFHSLKGLLLSLSISPETGHPNYEPMLKELSAIFQKYQQNGVVEFEYDTIICYGRLPFQSQDGQIWRRR